MDENKTKNMSYSKRGALWGFIISSLLVIAFSIWANYASTKSPDGYIPFYTILLIMTITYCVPATLIGLLIGYFLDKKWNK